jgi:hypothetical protein
VARTNLRKNDEIGLEGRLLSFAYSVLLLKKRCAIESASVYVVDRKKTGKERTIEADADAFSSMAYSLVGEAGSFSSV